MNHQDLVNSIAASMASQSIANEKEENETFEDKEMAYEEDKKDSEVFNVTIPLVTGWRCGFDVRDMDWKTMGSEEYMNGLARNEGMIRGMITELITADFTKPETDEMLNSFNDGLDELFKSFGIDPHYEVFENKTQVKPHILLFAKCFDAMTIFNVIAHNIQMHNLATQVFGFSDSLKQVADLNDITDMDNSIDGLISEDRSILDPITDDEEA